MIAQKHIAKIITVIMAVAVCLCLTAMVFSKDLAEAAGGTGITMDYASRLFDTDEIISVDIIMDEAEWEEMLAKAIEENYYQCDVEINGEMFYRVGIRPKGNTSLTAIAGDPDTDRYSLKLEFDQYVDGQTCHGLDKLILNNQYADATNMKEALVYDMYRYLGADASLYNYAKISVNGKYWGVYLALEAVEDSFLLRNYGATNGALYKPESMHGGNREKDFSAFGGGGFSMGGNGANLNYIDQNSDSYSAIWEGAVTNTTDADHKRVIEALKNIAEGTDPEKYMDVDNLLRYMAVHVFSVNEDSLSGMMAHNYYLYESGGRLNLLPWDYNLAFGGMGGMGKRGGGNSATSMVNSGIDEAFTGTAFFDTLMEDEEYHGEYYGYLQKLVEEYIYGGKFEEFYNRIRSQIDVLVESDPTAFYTYEEYEKAADTLYQAVRLRGRSISDQLDGKIPPAEGERQGDDTLIDASNLDLGAMGSMSMGDRMREWKENENVDNTVNNNDGDDGLTKDLDPSQIDGEMRDDGQFMGDMPDDGQFTGEMPDIGQFAKEMPDGGPFPGKMPEGGAIKGGIPDIGGQTPENSRENIHDENLSSSITNNVLWDNLILYGVCLCVLIVAFVFAKLFRRRFPKR